MVNITEVVTNSPFTQQIPQPLADVGSLAYCARAMKQTLEILTGARGNAPFDRAVLFSDLAAIGLIDPTTLAVSSAFATPPTGLASGDLSGSYPSPIVSRVNGVNYPSAPSANTVPLANGAGAVVYTSTSQLPGTGTNDDAAAGKIGQVISASAPDTTATVTITIASPGVITWTGHGLSANCPVQFTTTGALPTGLAVSTTYYVVGSSITTDTFKLATTIANAIAGTAINTSGVQSGTHTARSAAFLATGVTANIIAIQLTAGDWDVWGAVDFYPDATTTVTAISSAASTTSATLPAAPFGALSTIAATLTTGATQHLPTGTARLKFSITTVVHLVAASTFGTSTMFAGGIISARRRR